MHRCGHGCLQVRAFQQALQNVSDDRSPIERQRETDVIREFLQTRIECGTGGSLFIAGKPGTGEDVHQGMPPFCNTGYGYCMDVKGRQRVHL